jgi:hypothetical protein
MSEGSLPAAVASPSRRWSYGVALVVGVAAAVRLFAVVHKYASDIPFWDQWDFLTPLFDESGWSALFTRQHGPHRQGLGGLVAGVILKSTHWNLRALAYFGALCLCVAAVLSLLCVWRLFKPSWTDVALPLLIIAPTDSELYAGPVNPAHGPLPLVLVLLAAWALGLRLPRWRAAALGAIGAVAIYTGFAVLAAPMIVALLALDGVRAWRSHARGDLASAIAALLAIVASGSSFAVGYVFSSAVSCYRFPDPQPWLYFPFAGLQLLRPYATYERHMGVPLELAACAVLAAGAGLALWGFLRIAKRERSLLAETIFLLAGFSLLFAVNSAIGRVCLGLGTASATRYVPYALPMVAALYLALRAVRLPRPGGAMVLAGFAALALAANLSQTPNIAEALMYKEWKESFSACYLARHDLAGCEHDTRAVHPRADETHLQRKLDYLESHRLSLFRPAHGGPAR